MKTVFFLSAVPYPTGGLVPAPGFHAAGLFRIFTGAVRRSGRGRT